MKQVIKLIGDPSQAAATSKIKFGLSSISIYHLVRNKLLKEEKGESNAIKSPLHPDNIFGPLEPIMGLYQILTTLAHLMSFSVTFALIYYDQDKMIEADSVIFCHSPRFVVHSIIGPYYMTWIGCAFGFMQLSWRVWIVLYQRRLKLDTFTYLMLDDQLVRSHLDPQQALKSYTAEHGLNLAQRVMFYKVEAESHNTVALGLRPNRTPEARERLLKAAHLSFQLCLIPFIFIQIVFVSVTLWTSVYDIDIYYPGCEPSSSLLHAATRSIGSFVVSAIILFDCFGIYLFTFPLDYILIDDLKIYWSKIELEMMELYRLIREHRYVHDQQPMAEVDEKEIIYSFCHERSINSLKIFDDHHHLIAPQQQEKSKTRKQWMSEQVSNIGSLSYLTDSYNTFELRERIYLFQTVMCDFFDQLGEMNEYMTLAISMTFLIWLITNGVVSYIGVQIDTSLANGLIRFVQFFMLLIYCLFSAILLNLKSYIDPAYRILSSIMAQDPSLEKKRWLYLLKYYTVIPRHCFTIFRFAVFSSLIFFQSFSYTLTYSIYMYSFRA